ncbi:MAG TPA: AMP-binding protein [Terriglobales bacterium]
MATSAPAISALPRTALRFMWRNVVAAFGRGAAAVLYVLLWTFTQIFYRIRIVGAENIPSSGGALLIANHLSFVDVLLLGAATGRPVRYLIFQDLYRHPLIWPVAKAFKAIPIKGDLPPREMVQALRDAGRAIQRGELVCFFAEGEITRIGAMLPFRRGFERVMRGVSAPIIPVHLDVWGSIFSFEKGKFFWKWPKRVPYPVTVSFGKHMDGRSTAEEVRQAVAELHADAFAFHKQYMQPLHRGFFKHARRAPLRFSMVDARTAKPLSYFSALTKLLYLATRLHPVWQGQENVGILLPPSVAGALVNYAAQLMGKVPVNLNYTASAEATASAAEQTGLKTIISSKAFLERISFTLPPGVELVLLEELAANPRTAEKVHALALSLLPVRMLERRFGNTHPGDMDAPATIIFSSGSTGEPKGIVLTQFNVAANIDQVGQIFHFVPKDKMIGVLPFFHSFGFTVTLWLPPIFGIGAIYHANPLDAQVIGELSRKYHGSVIVATPTFLQSYLRRCEPEDFHALWLPIVGAEKLTDKLATSWQEKFGKRPLEGYGATECSPVVSVNSFDFDQNGIRQRGLKPGSIGRPLPGVAVRIVDPDADDLVSEEARKKVGDTGMLLVRGPNVMQGYLHHPEQTAEVLHEGWYATGDLAWMDDEGFLHIADRLSRFSKIAGEMVPHLKIEEALQEGSGASEREFVVTSVPDERRGERILVLHTASAEHLERALQNLAALPPLWRPKRDDFVRVDHLPLLGSGKIDLRGAREMARVQVPQ